jgi:hypothetical protein
MIMRLVPVIRWLLARGSAVMILRVVQAGIGSLAIGSAPPTWRKIASLRHRSAASISWPSVTGTITRTGVESHWKIWGGDTITRIHKPSVEYEYSVGGIRHRGNRVGFLETSTSSRRRAEQKAARYTVGSEVAVFYDPAAPSEACLEREAEAPRDVVVFAIAKWVPLVVGFLLVFAAAFVPDEWWS